MLTVVSIGYFLWVELQGYMVPDYGAMIVTDELVTRKEMKYGWGYVGFIWILCCRGFRVRLSRWIFRMR